MVSNESSAGKIKSKFSPNLIRFVVGFALCALFFFMASYLVFCVGLGAIWPIFYYFLAAGVFGLVGGLYAMLVKSSSIFESWRVFGVIASSKATGLVIFSLTVVPAMVSFFAEIQALPKAPFTLYLYWLIGLSLLLFCWVFQAFAPVVYKFSSFKDLMEKEGSALCLRADALHVLQEIERREREGRGVPKFLENDKRVVTKLSKGDIDIDADTYFVMREYSAHFKKRLRPVLSALLIIPAFLLVTLFVLKVITVGYEANIAADHYGGWWQAIYHGLFALSTQAAPLSN